MSRHNALHVVYPVLQSLVLGWLLLAIWAVGLGVFALSFWGGSFSLEHAAAALLSSVGGGLAVWWSWRTSATGLLTWDGECWHWEALGDLRSTGEILLSVVADAQFGVLLLAEAEGRHTQWLWVERRSQPERWMDLRRAIYASRRNAMPVPALSHD